MNVRSPGAWSDRLRSRRRARLASCAAGGAALAVGALLFWGPADKGNSPVDSKAGHTASGYVAMRGVPEGIRLPMPSSFDHARATIDGVDLIGATRYAAPHVLALRVLASAGPCGGAWPAHPTRTGFVLDCPDATIATTVPLIGHVFGPEPSHDLFGVPAAAEVSPPRPGSCWVLTKVVVHYRVGIRHHRFSTPYRMAVCASQDQLDGAVAAAAAS